MGLTIVIILIIIVLLNVGAATVIAAVLRLIGNIFKGLGYLIGIRK